MRGGYLATESSRDTSCRMGSLKNSGITVKECAGHTASSSHSQQTHHGACGLKSAVRGCGRRLDQSEFRPMAGVSFAEFPYSSDQRTQKRLLLAEKGGFKFIIFYCNI